MRSDHQRSLLPPYYYYLLPSHTTTQPTLLQNTQASTGRALDLGCAVGGSSFALARAYGEVHGLELSEAFVETAKQMQVREN